MSFATVLAFAALPVLGNFLGGLLAERVRVSQRLLSLALHLAAGVIVGVVAVELVPAALAVDAPWPVLGAFVLGGLLFVAMDHVTDHINARFGKAKDASAATTGIFAGVALDLFSDGIMIGAGSTLSLSLGLLLALGQVPADIPEGFATNATFRHHGMPRKKRLLLMAALGLPILLGAAIGFFALRGRSEVLQVSVLAFTAGALLTLVMEEVVPEAHEGRESRLAAVLFLAGFALFFAVSALFEA